jgi:hypothetical protein
MMLEHRQDNCNLARQWINIALGVKNHRQMGTRYMVSTSGSSLPTVDDDDPKEACLIADLRQTSDT